MDFEQLIKSRHSTRRFLDTPLTEQQQQLFHQCLSYVPSGNNKRPTEIIEVTDPQIICELKACKNAGTLALSTAPMVYVIIGDKDKSDVWVENASILSSYLMLAAEYSKLSSCWIQIHQRKDQDNNDSEERVREVLSIPKNYGILCLIAVGVPDDILSSQCDQEFKLKIHHNKMK